VSGIIGASSAVLPSMFLVRTVRAPHPVDFEAVNP